MIELFLIIFLGGFGIGGGLAYLESTERINIKYIFRNILKIRQKNEKKL